MSDELATLLQKQEPLHPDLVACRYTDDHLGVCIKHPLVFSIMHHDVLNAWTNRLYEQKRQQLDEARRERNWVRYIWLHERPYRINALMGVAEQIEAGGEYWDAVRDVIIDSENLHENAEAIETLMSSKRPGRCWLMTRKERIALHKMSDPLTVFRGHVPGLNLQGWSWTLDRERAQWFATRFHSHGAVAVGEVKRKDVLAYWTGRGEEEIFVHPDNVTLKEV